MEDLIAGHHAGTVGGPFGVYALQLNGSSGVLTAPAGPSGAAARFDEIWVKPPAAATAHSPLLIPLLAAGEVGTADKDYQLAYYGYTDPSACRFHFNGWSNDWDINTNLFLAGKSNLVGLGYDGNLTMALFLNGALLGTKTLARPLNTTGTTTKYGKSNFGTPEYSAAAVVGVRRFSTNRTLAQHQASMGQPLPAGTAGLHSQYLFTEGSGLTTDDSSGNNRTMALSATGVTWTLNN